MVLPLNDKWEEKYREGTVRDVDLVVVSTKAVPTTEGVDKFSFVSSPHAGLGYPHSVNSVSPLSPTLDHITNEYTIGDYRVTLRRDRKVADMVRTVRLKNKYCHLKIGAAGLQESEYVSQIKTVIHDWSVDAPNGVTLRCRDVGGLLRGQKILMYWVNRHPLEAIEDILKKCNVPATLYDANSLNPANYPDIGHFNVTRQTVGPTNTKLSNGLTEPKDAWELVTELLLLVNGAFVPNSDGIYSFVYFDLKTPIVRELTAADVVSVRQATSSDRLINRWTMLARNMMRDPLSKEIVVQATDPTSVADHAVPGEAEGYFDESLGQSPWINGSGFLWGRYPSMISHEGATFAVYGQAISGGCGCHFDTTANNWARPSWGQLSDAKLGYLLFEGLDSGGQVRREILSVKRVLIFVAHPGREYDQGGEEYAACVKYVIKARGLLGTRVIDWKNTTWQHPINNALYKVRVYDITIPVWVTERKLELTANGSPELVVELSRFKHFDLQVGDFVGLVDDVPLYYGADGAPPGQKWRIVQKVPTRPGYTLHLKWVPTEIPELVDREVPLAPSGLPASMRPTVEAQMHEWFVRSLRRAGG